MRKVPFSANARNADTHSTGATTANPIPVHAFHLPRSAGRTRISFSAATAAMIAAGVSTANNSRKPRPSPAAPNANDRSAFRLELGAGSAAVTLPGGVAGDLPSISPPPRDHQDRDSVRAVTAS